MLKIRKGDKAYIVNSVVFVVNELLENEEEIFKLTGFKTYTWNGEAFVQDR